MTQQPVKRHTQVAHGRCAGNSRIAGDLDLDLDLDCSLVTNPNRPAVTQRGSFLRFAGWPVQHLARTQTRISELF
jgi:hypothetical protein